MGCRKREIVPEPYRPKAAHEAYRHGLEQAGLLDTALGRAWSQTAASALHSPTSVDTPYREALYVDPATAFGVGYRFGVTNGQRVEVQIDYAGPARGRLYLDLFRLEEGKPPLLVASAPEDELRLEFEPRWDGQYLLRLQAELLSGGQAIVTIANQASLDFPVAGYNYRAIQSGFGAERDGGRRSHHGVDIFAPRHTLVLAPSRAYVRRVGQQSLGGRVVWLRDEQRGLSLYFAHLQTQAVQEGQWVEAGDVLGTVGNSGNARTTPTHLHFGVYRRGQGPIDPVPFIRRMRVEPPKLTADLGALGQWVRSRRSSIPVGARPARRSEALRTAPEHTPMVVLGAAADRFRVRLPDGSCGFVPARDVETALEPIESERLETERALLDGPTPNAASKTSLMAGDEMQVLGTFDSFLWVRTASGTGWLRP